ncbi:MAG: dolichyl-phosphate beta-glucosyltransferase [Chloroflexota bacterium]|nr:MAG: dolichyl-phosphate beta-glucosyltransferase [Chloroflexota bacterium]
MNWGRFLRSFGTLIGFLLIVVFFWSQRPATFMSVRNLLNITQQVSILGIVAFTMTVVMVVGDFDLSVGTMASLSGIIVGLMLQNDHALGTAILVALLAGAAGGILNGVLIAYVGILPFVATLATLTVFSGAASSLSGGRTIFGQVFPDGLVDFANGGIPLLTLNEQVVRIPHLTLIALIVLAVVWFVLEQTVFGRRLYAIGGNMEASRLAGVRVRFLRLLTFVITGLGASLAGVVLTSQLATANPTLGDGLMLNAIAAVFLGMTMSQEGEPRVLGTLVGVLLIGVLANGFTQVGVDTYVQRILTGVIIIASVTLSSISRRRS